MSRPRSVIVTRNFDRNLAAIRDFLSTAGASEAFGDLVARLASDVIPNLQRFPDLGADFLARAPLSADGIALFEAVVKAAGPGSHVRQLFDGDYLILYLVRGNTVHLLAAKHHRQISFDLMGHWP
jgi:plasmid stabilization system protein ParE